MKSFAERQRTSSFEWICTNFKELANGAHPIFITNCFDELLPISKVSSEHKHTAYFHLVKFWATTILAQWLTKQVDILISKKPGAANITP